MTPRVLFICGSLNQTMMMHKVSQHLGDLQCRFTHFYTTGAYRVAENLGLLDFTILGEKQRRYADTYLKDHGLPMDPQGASGPYDLIVTGTDIVVPRNARTAPLMLIQEGMTDPETLWFHVVKWGRHVGLPLWLAKTSTTGLSDLYDRFCVASEGYRNLFIRKGVRPEKMVVTGIPNYDNAAAFLNNDFPQRGYVLVVTSDIRENFGWDRREAFLQRAKAIAADRDVIVKLHPNECPTRRGAEVSRIIPYAKVISDYDPHILIANSDVVICQYSTLVYTGIALGKEVHSYFDVEELRRLCPLQNGGTSAHAISLQCRDMIHQAHRRHAVREAVA